eukprot:scaffold1046_cov120-Skeletonema_marinoi.AAC.1
MRFDASNHTIRTSQLLVSSLNDFRTRCGSKGAVSLMKMLSSIHNDHPAKSAPFTIIDVPTTAIIEDEGVVAVSRPFSYNCASPLRHYRYLLRNQTARHFNAFGYVAVTPDEVKNENEYNNKSPVDIGLVDRKEDVIKIEDKNKSVNKYED